MAKSRWIASRSLAAVLGAALALPVHSLPRSAAAKAEFQRANPCPATSKSRGACPGWEIDHVIPLKCGGPDRPANMQWLTTEQHKAKTRSEARDCRQ